MHGVEANQILRRRLVLRSHCVPVQPGVCQQAKRRSSSALPSAAVARELWIETANQAVLTAAVESGHNTIVFGPGVDASVGALGIWRALGAKITAL